jgi:hypothetical protein
VVGRGNEGVHRRHRRRGGPDAPSLRPPRGARYPQPGPAGSGQADQIRQRDRRRLLDAGRRRSLETAGRAPQADCRGSGRRRSGVHTLTADDGGDRGLWHRNGADRRHPWRRGAGGISSTWWGTRRADCRQCDGPGGTDRGHRFAGGDHRPAARTMDRRERRPANAVGAKRRGCWRRQGGGGSGSREGR